MPIILLPATAGLGAGHPFEALASSGDARPGGLEALVIYNDLVMNDRRVVDKFRLLQIDGLQDADIRDNRFNSPAEHGEVALGALYGGRTITLTGRIEAFNVGKLRDMQQALRTAFINLQEKPLILRTRDLNEDVFINCRKVQPIAMVETQNTAWPWRDFMVTLRASNPRILAWVEDVSQDYFFLNDSFTDTQALFDAKYDYVEGSNNVTIDETNDWAYVTAASARGVVNVDRTYEDSETILHWVGGTGPTTQNPVVYVKALGTGTADLLRITTVSSTPAIQISKRVSNSFTTLATSSNLAAAITATTNYWLRVVVVGNDVTAEHWLTDPLLGGSPARTVTHTLAGADATKFGNNIRGYSGFGWSFSSSNFDMKLPDFKALPRELNHPLMGGTIVEIPSSTYGEGTYGEGAYGGSGGGVTSSGGGVRNVGNFPAQPRIRVGVGGTGGSITGTLLVTNNTNGQTLSFSGLALTTGQWIEIDTAKRTVVRDNGSNQFSKLVIGSDWLELEPGFNDISVMAPTVTGEPYITFWHRSTWM